MQDMIISFIAQAKECKLPGIGKFRVITTPAEHDTINKKILPPVTEVLFTGKEEKVSDELVKYIATRKNISTDDAFTSIKEWCSELVSKLKDEEEVILPLLGTLKKGTSGNILFHSYPAIQFLETAPAERVVHKNTEHTMLVGDKETTSSAMNLLLNEEVEVKNNTWKTIALILLTVALVLLLFYFYEHSSSLSAMGNQVKISPQSPAPTYSPQ